MHGVVKIRGLNTLYSLKELPEDRSELDLVEEGAWISVPPEITDWPPEVTDPPPPTVARSKVDPKKYRLFRLAGDVEPAGYEPTGLSYGGVRTPEGWRRRVRMISADRAFAAIPPDPPGVWEEAMRIMRENR